MCDSNPSVTERMDLLSSVGEECTTQDELLKLVASGKSVIRCYDGFEPSGRMHIAQGLIKAINVNKCTRAGCHFIFWVADWFALMNDKMGGDLLKIKTVGEYFVEIWRAAGMDLSRVEFQWASEVIASEASTYWPRVLEIARHHTLTRLKRCGQIMGRENQESLSAAQILYPLMQCADIFHLGADICQLGVDQRKVNMLAREHCSAIHRKFKPIILSHHMLSGLLPGEAKMSKSNPDSAIFMEDTEEEVSRKIQQAHCPVNPMETNPCLEYVKYLIFTQEKQHVTIGRNTFYSQEEVEDAFRDGSITEEEIKNMLSSGVNSLLEPVREHFKTNQKASALLARIRSWQATVPATIHPPCSIVESKSPRALAWLPLSWSPVPLAETLRLVSYLNETIASHTPAVLVIPDWSASACGVAGGVEKTLCALADKRLAIIKGLGLSPEVEIVKQSEVVMTDPSSYWLHAIRAGRSTKLREIETALIRSRQLVESSLGALPSGEIVAVVMHSADIQQLSATECLAPLVDADGLLTTISAEATEGQITTKTAAVHVQTLSSEPLPFTLSLGDPSRMDQSQCLLMDDLEMDLTRKIRRAFAPEGNPEGNPLISLASYFIQKGQSLAIKQAPEYSDIDGKHEWLVESVHQLVCDYSERRIHPGDLKAAVIPLVHELTKQARATLTTTEGKRRTTMLKTAAKRLG